MTQAITTTLDTAAAGVVPPAERGEEESSLFYGRWTVEEEKYAEMLIEEFRCGNLGDIGKGPDTMRSYLAVQLRCAPKRISKKYESSGYNGRLQYVRKDSALAPEEAKERREKLESLRKSFEARRAALPKKAPKKRKNQATSRRLVEESRRVSHGSYSLASAADRVATETSSFQSPPSAASAATLTGASLPAEVLLPGQSLGGNTTTRPRPGLAGDSFLNAALLARAATAPATTTANQTLASLLLANQQRASVTNGLLSRTHPMIPSASLLGTAALPSTTTDAINEVALVRNLVASAPANTSHLLHTAALKRRLDTLKPPGSSKKLISEKDSKLLWRRQTPHPQREVSVWIAEFHCRQTPTSVPDCLKRVQWEKCSCQGETEGKKASCRL